MIGEQKTGQYLGHAGDDLNPRILHIFKGTFLLDVAQYNNEYISLGVFSHVHLEQKTKY